MVNVHTASRASLELLITLAIIRMLFEYLKALNIRNTLKVRNILNNLKSFKPLFTAANDGMVDIRSTIAKGVNGYLKNYSDKLFIDISAFV